MRHGKWKVLAQLNGGRFPRLQNVINTQLQSVLEAQLTNFEIYDMDNDVAENENLVNSEGAEIGELQKLLTTRYKELVGDSHTWTVVKDK